MKEGANRYLAVNWAAAGLLLYALLLPFISSYCAAWFPSLWRCPFAVLTGRPCPLCGLTRDFGALWRGDLHRENLNPMALPLLFGAVIEILFRLYFCAKRRRATRTLVFVDAAVHGVVAVVFFSWICVRLNA